MRLFILRHGATDDPPVDADRVLTEKGIGEDIYNDTPVDPKNSKRAIDNRRKRFGTLCQTNLRQCVAMYYWARVAGI